MSYCYSIMLNLDLYFWTLYLTKTKDFPNLVLKRFVIRANELMTSRVNCRGIIFPKKPLQLSTLNRLRIRVRIRQKFPCCIAQFKVILICLFLILKSLSELINFLFWISRFYSIFRKILINLNPRFRVGFYHVSPRSVISNPIFI